MADIILDEQGTPATPASGTLICYPDSAASVLLQRNDAGIVQGRSMRAAIAQQTGFAVDTYITNSGLIIPSVSLQAGTVCIWYIVVTKTAAGTATPIWQVRIGTAQSVADTSRLSITTATQTAAVDTGFVTIIATCRSAGVSGVLQGAVRIHHNLAATGLANTPAGFNLVEGTSAGFDNTALGGSYIGISVNGGASAAWTVNQVIGQVLYG